VVTSNLQISEHGKKSMWRRLRGEEEQISSFTPVLSIAVEAPYSPSASAHPGSPLPVPVPLTLPRSNMFLDEFAWSSLREEPHLLPDCVQSYLSVYRADVTGRSFGHWRTLTTT
jgi:hypothetical protein